MTLSRRDFLRGAWRREEPGSEEDAAAPAPFDGGMYAPKAEEIPAPFEAPRRHRRSDRRQGK